MSSVLESLKRSYRELLIDGVIPFWLRHGVDSTHGGVLNCMTEEGVRLAEDKYIWSQGRFLWTMAAYYNRVERDKRVLDAARGTAEFLLRHGRDEAGRWVYRTSRDGVVMEGSISIYADCFAIYGLSEYYRAAGDPAALQAAVAGFEQARRRVAQPGFNDTAPYRIPPNRRLHAVPMILTETANELARTTGDAMILEAARGYSSEIFRFFVQPQRACLFEYLDGDYQPLPGPEGRTVNPGHAIESMWFQIHLGQTLGDAALVRQACQVIRWHIEKGWDEEHGGILLAIDADGGEPYPDNWHRKPWWPHTEALYALLLAAKLTGEPWCRVWHDRVREWSLVHYTMTGAGEWRQRLDRTGMPIDEVVALPVKDPFHLPRALILILGL